MNPVIVEHSFVTPLQSAQAMQILGQVLRARGFDQDGEQQFKPDQADWTVINFSRGLIQTHRAMAIPHFYQTLRVEWDRGRVSMAYSLDPHRAKTPVRQQCAELLLLASVLIENAITGERQPAAVLNEWARYEEPLVLAPGAAGRGYVRTKIRGPIWISGCIVVIAILLIAACTALPDIVSKCVYLVLGAGAIGLCVRLLFTLKKPALAVERSKLVSGGLAGGLMSLLIAGYCLLPQIEAPSTTQTAMLTPLSSSSKSPTIKRVPRTPPRPAPPVDNFSQSQVAPNNTPQADAVPDKSVELPPPFPNEPHPSADEVANKLDKINTFWSDQTTQPTDLLPTMKGVTQKDDDGNFLVHNFGHRLATPRAYHTPETFRIVAMTDSTNIRLGFGATQVIFNWEMNRDELRIDGGPLAGKHKKGAGAIPPNQWVAIEMQVMDDAFVLKVDGEERYRGNGDFAHAPGPLTIYTNAGATVKVHSVERVEP